MNAAGLVERFSSAVKKSKELDPVIYDFRLTDDGVNIIARHRDKQISRQVAYIELLVHRLNLLDIHMMDMRDKLLFARVAKK